MTGVVALVTGATGGIGQAIVASLRAEGATVLSVDHPRALAADPHAFPCDLTDRQALAGLADSTGPVDVLVNCAGVILPGDSLAASDADWDLSFEVNVRAPFALCRAYLPTMRKRRSGSIINIVSVTSLIRSLPERAAYSASKAALMGLTLSIARDEIRHGIRCNAIAPGTILTPLMQDRIDRADDPAAMRARYEGQQPGGVLGSPAQVAAAVAFLAGQGSEFITGTVIPVDGGMGL